MDLYMRFNRGRVDDRQVDTLVGLSKGLVADEKVNQEEAEFLLNWLVQSRNVGENPLIANLLEKVEAVLQDGTLDSDEAAELLAVLRNVAGGESELGELAKPSSLPIDQPPPQIELPKHCFVFTGTCVYGSRGSASSQLGKAAVRSLRQSQSPLTTLPLPRASPIAGSTNPTAARSNRPCATVTTECRSLS